MLIARLSLENNTQPNEAPMLATSVTKLVIYTWSLLFFKSVASLLYRSFLKRRLVNLAWMLLLLQVSELGLSDRDEFDAVYGFVQATKLVPHQFLRSLQL